MVLTRVKVKITFHLFHGDVSSVHELAAPASPAILGDQSGEDGVAGVQLGKGLGECIVRVSFTVSTRRI